MTEQTSHAQTKVSVSLVLPVPIFSSGMKLNAHCGRRQPAPRAMDAQYRTERGMKISKMFKSGKALPASAGIRSSRGRGTHKRPI